MGKWIRDGEEVEAKSDNRIIIGEMNEWIPPDMFEEESSMNNGCRISPFKKRDIIKQFQRKGTRKMIVKTFIHSNKWWQWKEKSREQIWRKLKELHTKKLYHISNNSSLHFSRFHEFLEIERKIKEFFSLKNCLSCSILCIFLTKTFSRIWFKMRL